MLTESLLKNLFKYELNHFLKKLNVKDFSNRIKTSNGKDYSPYVRILSEELLSPTGNFNKKALDDFLFDQIFFKKNNYHWVFNLENDFIRDVGLSNINDIKQYLSKHQKLKFNSTLPGGSKIEEYEICTTRIRVSNNNLDKVYILLKTEKINNKRGKVDLYCGITIDISNNLLTLKFNLNNFEANPDRANIILKIKHLLTSDGAMRPLKLQYSSITESNSKDLIFSLFKELSEDAERILNNKAPQKSEAQIKNLLNNLNITPKSDYIKQIKAVIYQDIADSFNISLFPKGWVFRFLFREGDFTRASSRTDDFSPVYKTKVYWNLKEIVFKEQKMHEAGYIWNIDQQTSPVFVKMVSKNDVIILQYYDRKPNYINREVKEDFVLQKINGKLFRD